MNAPTTPTTPTNEIRSHTAARIPSDLYDEANRSHEMKLMSENLARAQSASRLERARERHRQARLSAAVRAQQRAELDVAREHTRIFLAGR